MKPTIGRIVTYHLTEADKKLAAAKYENVNDDLPAIIVAVWSETTVNLKVFNDGREDLHKMSCSIGEHPSNWSWPERVG